jgi:DNA-binding winged helix-turn-helix (wHTH) protein
MELLILLLERQGSVVTRQEIVDRLWGKEVFVDTEHGINTAIRKVRQALKDDPDNPRFVHTVSGKGYRFIAERNGHSSGSAPSEALQPMERRAPRPPALSAVEGSGAKALPRGPDRIKRPARTWKFFVGGAVIMIALVIGGGLIWRTRPPRHLTDKDTVVLGEFANSTGDPVFDGTLREGLAVELQQSPFLSLLSDQGMRESLQMMGKPADAYLTPEITREVCIRTGSIVAVEGSIALIGTRYNLILKAIDCTSGDLFASSESQASDKSHVLDALESAASALRKKLGESLGSLQKYNVPLRQTTTPSLEALQAYTLGFSARASGDDLAAVPFFERATQLDPNFAMAYDQMGDAYGDMGETALSAEDIAKAYGLRAGVGEREKLLIESEFHLLNTGDLAKVRRICEVGVRIYPREAGFRVDLGSVSYYLGQYEDGLREDREVLRARPNSLFTYRQLILGNLLLNRIEDAEALAGEAQAKGLDSNLAGMLYGIAFYRDNPAEMSHQAARATGVPGQEDLLLAMRADTAAFTGHLGEARQLSRRAQDSAERAMKKETATGYYAVAALRDALFGDAARARREIAAAQPHSRGRDVEYALALALAARGASLDS